MRKIGYSLGYLEGRDAAGEPVRGRARENLTEALVTIDGLLMEYPPRPSEEQSFKRIGDLQRECERYLAGWKRGENQLGVVRERLRPAYMAVAVAGVHPLLRLPARWNIRRLERDLDAEGGGVVSETRS